MQSPVRYDALSRCSAPKIHDNQLFGSVAKQQVTRLQRDQYSSLNWFTSNKTEIIIEVRYNYSIQ